MQMNWQSIDVTMGTKTPCLRINVLINAYVCVWIDLVLHKNCFPSTAITSFGKIELVGSFILPKLHISVWMRIHEQCLCVCLNWFVFA